MKDYLGMAWGFIQKKLGTISIFIKGAVESLKVAIANRDIEKINKVFDEMEARFVETEETIAAGRDLIAEGRRDIADGNLDGLEAEKLLQKVQHLLDEGEDILTGVDEDDAPPTEATS